MRRYLGLHDHMIVQSHSTPDAGDVKELPDDGGTEAKKQRDGQDEIRDRGEQIVDVAAYAAV